MPRAVGNEGSKLLRTVSVLVFVLLSCTACGGRQTPKLLTVPGEPGHLIEINGHMLYFQCIGEGEPTVILEAGYGGDRRSWDVVEPDIARTTRVCSYDRAGLGLSAGEQPKRRSATDQLDDLEDILGSADIDPPYVVVGHSYGGVLGWQLARQHEEDVVGLVLLDSAHPGQIERFRAALPPMAPDEGEEVRQLRRSLFEEGEASPENVLFARAMREVGDPGSLGETRLIVITAGQEDPTGLPRRIATRLRRVWFALQDDYARRSTDSVHVIARYSPHFIQSNLGQPELVLKAIREVVLAARDGRQLHECRALFQPPGAKCVS
jgi:pimeloyl-ACP methyl ester carboxylesterase